MINIEMRKSINLELDGHIIVYFSKELDTNKTILKFSDKFMTSPTKELCDEIINYFQKLKELECQKTSLSFNELIDLIKNKFIDCSPRLANMLKAVNDSLNRGESKHWHIQQIDKNDINSLTKKIFFKIRNLGKVSWLEFENIRNNVLPNIQKSV